MMPTKEEKDAEIQLIVNFADKVKATIIKLQKYNDDGKTDGIIEYHGKKINIEVRRKGFKNHKGKICSFNEGWENKKLVEEGIFLNESTIRNHKNNTFIFIVEINGSAPRACVINDSKINQLLNQPYNEMTSTNSGIKQSVKCVPVNWFKEY